MKLSLMKYGWKCAVGTEAVYAACLWYERSLTGNAAALHRALFELLPGFAWISVRSVLISGLCLFVYAWVFAGYYVWMFNTSQEDSG